MTMNATHTFTNRIDDSSLAMLARKTGDIWSVLLPATHPGAPEGNKTVNLRGLAHHIGIKPDAEWLRRTEQFLEEENHTGGGPGLAVYVGDDFIEAFECEIPQARIGQGGCCHLLPLIPESQKLHEFYVLGLSKKLIRLVRFQDGICTELDLPEEMPASLEEFHTAQESERNSESQGRRAGTHFVTNAERDAADQHLEHFFQAVDGAIAKVVGQKKIMLMGVAEESALFRRTSKSLQFLDGQINSGIRDISLGQIAQQGGAMVATELSARRRSALERIREWADRSLVEDDLRRIIVAAQGGQVDELCLKDPSAKAGLIEKAEDLLNTAAVETLRKRGRVYMVPEEEMQGFNEAVALMRF